MGTTNTNTILNNIIELGRIRSPKISPSKMCDEIGISRSLITKLKAGPEKSINAVTAQKIADFFGVPVDRVLGSNRTEISHTTVDAKITMEQISVAIDDMSVSELVELLGDIADTLKRRGF